MFRIIIPIDELKYFRGVGIPPTNKSKYLYIYIYRERERVSISMICPSRIIIYPWYFPLPSIINHYPIIVHSNPSTIVISVINSKYCILLTIVHYNPYQLDVFLLALNTYRAAAWCRTLLCRGRMPKECQGSWCAKRMYLQLGGVKDLPWIFLLSSHGKVDKP